MKTVKLDKFKLRDYQIPLFESFDSGFYKRFLIVWPRRAGKDICAFNLMIRAALHKVGTYFYVFPTFSSGRRILWDAIDIDGNKVIDYYCPEDIVKSRNQQQMRINLINGSAIQVIGSDDADKALVGTNAAGIIFSEYAIQQKEAWLYSIPILKASDGWALFVSTPRGKNHFFDLYQFALEHQDWFVQHLTVEDTKHLSLESIQKDIDQGLMSRELASQEYWCRFDAMGVSGSYYGSYINDLYSKGHITTVLWDPYIPVHTAWDIGYNDPTCIIFFQYHNDQIRIIDLFQDNKKGLDFYAKMVLERPYTYGKHLCPFDMFVHDLSSGISRWRMMQDLGITFLRYTDKAITIDEGIENVRRYLPKFWIDDIAGKPLIIALENYRESYNETLNTFSGKPIHDQYSHICDALRYLCSGLPFITNNSTSPQELDRRFAQAKYGSNQTLVNNPFYNQNNGFRPF